MQQDAIGLVQDGGARSRVFGHQQIGSKGWVALRQTVLFWHIYDQAAAVVNFFAAKPHLGAHHQIAIEQTTDTHEHDRRVCRDVTDLVGRTRLGRQHPALAGWRVALLQLDLPPPCGQQCAQASGGHFRQLTQVPFGLVVKGLEALLTDVFLVILQVHQDLGRVAGNAQTGADHQESQNQKKPPSAVDRVEFEGGEQLGPKRAKLVHVIDTGFVLFEHRADDGGDANDRQQRNGKTHGRQQFDHSLPSGRAALGFMAGSNSRHGVLKKRAQKAVGQENGGKPRQKRSRPEKPALDQVISAEAELCRRGVCFALKPPETSRASPGT